MEIIIISKTHKGQAACVGGMIVVNKQFVRILNQGKRDQPANTDFNIGDIWEVEFTKANNIIPPHIEDIIILYKRFSRRVSNVSDFILNSGVTIFRGSPEHIFNGKLGWTGSGVGYIENKENLPDNSVGFWISDIDLKFDGTHYLYDSDNFFDPTKKIKFVGFQSIIDVIPAGKLIRISLARWWKPEDSEMSERCYLQLSGWY
jgi:hypothetical protein